MRWTLPNILTLTRIAVIPVIILIFFIPGQWSATILTILFVAAGITDWLDGLIARHRQLDSKFGAFLDPVADKLLITIVLVLLVGDNSIRASVFSSTLFTITCAIIIGREILISALREWMAEQNKRSSVAVSRIGKIKTVGQFTAIAMLLYQQPLAGISMLKAGEMLLYLSALLTLWSMQVYLKSALRETFNPPSPESDNV